MRGACKGSLLFWCLSGRAVLRAKSMRIVFDGEAHNPITAFELKAA